MEHTVRIKLVNNSLKIYHANHYTTKDVRTKLLNVQDPFWAILLSFSHRLVSMYSASE